MLYSASAGGFFLPEVHGSAIPADAVPVTPEAYASLMAAQAAGSMIQSDEDGNPVAVAPPALTPAELLEIERDGMVASAFQARAAMAQAGKLAAVEALVEAQGGLTLIAWQHAIEWRRRSPVINALASHPSVNLSPTELDDLFRAARQITI